VRFWNVVAHLLGGERRRALEEMPEKAARLLSNGEWHRKVYIVFYLFSIIVLLMFVNDCKCVDDCDMIDRRRR
jgi:hypothetical protein